MKRLLPLVLAVIVLAAGCRRSSTAAPGASTPTPATSPAASGTASAPAATAPGGTAATAEPPAKPVPATLPAVVARVNGESVEGWELESAVKQAEANAGSPVPSEERDRVFRSILDELVTYHMLAQEARAEKLTVTSAELDAQIKMIRAMFQTEEAFQQALLLRGLTPERLADQEQRGLEYQKLLQAQVDAKITVPDADVDAFYQQNLDKFKQGETIHASHIFFAVPKTATEAQKNAARARAQSVLEQLQKGGDFAALAKKYSEDATADKGGDLGFFGRGDLPPDFEAAAYGLKPGETSGVVELSAGFHIIRVHARKPPRTVPLTEVRDNVKAYLFQSRRQTALEQFIDGLKAKAKIEILI